MLFLFKKIVFHSDNTTHNLLNHCVTFILQLLLIVVKLPFCFNKVPTAQCALVFRKPILYIASMLKVLWELFPTFIAAKAKPKATQPKFSKILLIRLLLVTQ